MSFKNSLPLLCKLLIVNILLISMPSLMAKPLTKAKMISLGETAFLSKTQTKSATVQSCEFLGEGNNPLLAVLNFDDGFLILSGDDAAEPVLAYSPTGHFDLQNPAPGAMYWIDQYQNEIRTMRETGLKASPEIQQKWYNLTHNSSKEITTTVVSPLLTALWNQTIYYNSYSPSDPESPAGYDGRTPNGCVAVAMAMIVYYHRYPVHGQGYHVNHTNYGNFYVNFAEQTYHYDAMEDELNGPNNEVAKLIFHCATAVDMMYSPAGSGAYSQNVVDALVNYFSYDESCEYLYRYYHYDDEWQECLETELDAGRPVYYSGCSDDGCHAFVCDGYDNNGYFHFNFGWGGYSNGFYVLSGSDDQHPIGDFDDSQAMIRYIQPKSENYPEYCNSKIINECYSGTLEDGSGSYDYQNNSDCTYIITGDSLIGVRINLQRFATEENADFLKFWDGAPAEDNLLLSLSGPMPTTTSYQFMTDSLYITFTSDESGTDAGWHFRYDMICNMPPCNSKLYRQYLGTLTDGSADGENYRYCADCRWMIRLKEANYITFTFNKFDISPEDELRFYDISESPHVLLATYSGHQIPANKTFYTNKVMINFHTDNYLTGDGFSLNWEADYLPEAIEDYQDDEVELYPNPASNAVLLKFNCEINNIKASVFDMTGKQVMTLNPDYCDNNRIKLDVSALSNGIYMLFMHDNDKIYRKKIIIAR